MVSKIKKLEFAKMQTVDKIKQQYKEKKAKLDAWLKNSLLMVEASYRPLLQRARVREEEELTK